MLDTYSSVYIVKFKIDFTDIWSIGQGFRLLEDIQQTFVDETMNILQRTRPPGLSSIYKSQLILKRAKNSQELVRSKWSHVISFTLQDVFSPVYARFISSHKNYKCQFTLLWTLVTRLDDTVIFRISAP